MAAFFPQQTQFLIFLYFIVNHLAAYNKPSCKHIPATEYKPTVY